MRLLHSVLAYVTLLIAIVCILLSNKMVYFNVATSQLATTSLYCLLALSGFSMLLFPCFALAKQELNTLDIKTLARESWINRLELSMTGLLCLANFFFSLCIREVLFPGKFLLGLVSFIFAALFIAVINKTFSEKKLSHT